MKNKESFKRELKELESMQISNKLTEFGKHRLIVFKELEKAYEDGKLSDEERKKIMKECLDVAKAVMKVFWK